MNCGPSDNALKINARQWRIFFMSIAFIGSAALAQRAVGGANSQPPNDPSTQPTSRYDKFNDVTNVSIGFGGVRIGYSYGGQQAKGWIDQLTLSVDRGVVVNGDRLIFLIDGTRRLRVDLNDHHAALISADWLSQLAGAKSIEINTGEPGAGTALTDTQVASIRALLEKAGYYLEAKRSAEEDRKRLWTPGKKLVFVINTGGDMLSCFDFVRSELLHNVLDHPAPGLSELFLAPNDEGKITYTNVVYPPVPAEGLGEIMRTTDFGTARARSFIAELTPKGAPPIAAALESSLTGKPDAVILLTINSSEDLAADLPRIQAKLVEAKVPVNILAFSTFPTREDAGFKALAAATKGTYRRISLEGRPAPRG